MGVVHIGLQQRFAYRSGLVGQSVLGDCCGAAAKLLVTRSNSQWSAHCLQLLLTSQQIISSYQFCK
jgi:hypothetical protein